MKLKISIFLLLVIGLGLGSYIYAVNDKEVKKMEVRKEVKAEPKEYKVSLLMVGDVLIHGTVYNDAKIGNNQYDFKPMLSNVKPLVKEHDLALYNQETTIGGKAMGLSTYPMFNSPEEIGLDMVDTGFNLVALANNHTLDRGEKAVLNSLDFWKEQPVMTAGSYKSFEDREKLKIGEEKNIKYGLLAYTTLTNGLNPPKGKEHYVNIYGPEQAKIDIEALRPEVDVLMVSMHWGSEYTHTPSTQQREIANHLASLGVDIIIGTHPHVVQPVEYIDNTIVIYSLGNFISSQIGEPRLVGGIVTLEITKTVFEDKSEISKSLPTIDLVYTYYDRNRKNIKLYLFNQLDNKILNNYQQIYEKYSKIMQAGNENILIKGIEAG